MLEVIKPRASEFEEHPRDFRASSAPMSPLPEFPTSLLCFTAFDCVSIKVLRKSAALSLTTVRLHAYSCCPPKASQRPRQAGEDQEADSGRTVRPQRPRDVVAGPLRALRGAWLSPEAAVQAWVDAVVAEYQHRPCLLRGQPNTLGARPFTIQQESLHKHVRRCPKS